MRQKLFALGLLLLLLVLAGTGCDTVSVVKAAAYGGESTSSGGMNVLSDSCGSYAYPGPCLTS